MKSTKSIVQFLVLASAVSCVTGESAAQVQTAKLTALDAAGLQLFGGQVSISGDLAIVGAERDDQAASDAGAAYVFRRDPSGLWTQEAKLLADDAATDDGFGASVAISENLVLVGAPRHNGAVPDAGVVYVFVRVLPGVWAQEGTLTSSDQGSLLEGDQFGGTVALDGELAVVGAKFDDVDGSAFIPFGSAFVFRRGAGGTWTEEAKLIADPLVDSAQLGSAVAVNGDLVVLGARFQDYATGAVYVFHHAPDGTWSQEALLVPDDASPSDLFGTCVAVSGDAVLAGSSGDEHSGLTNPGSAYVFRRHSDGAWEQEAKLIATDALSQDRFGSASAIVGDLAIVGQSGTPVYATTPGAAYLFQRDLAGTWTQKDKLTAADPSSADLFGISVALSGEYLLVGARDDDDACPGSRACNSGSAYIFNLTLSPADLNADGAVDGADLGLLLSAWGSADAEADIDGDGEVNGADFGLLLAAWTG